MRRLGNFSLFTSMETLLTAKDIQKALCIGRSAFYSLIREPAFPAPLKINSRTYRWHRVEFETWLSQKRAVVLPIKKAKFKTNSNFYVVNGVRFRKSK
jgi:predicted DNA-binding transcriptional regulator AlpA